MKKSALHVAALVAVENVLLLGGYDVKYFVINYSSIFLFKNYNS